MWENLIPKIFKKGCEKMIKIKSIKFYNHKIFGNQVFDFTIDGTTPVNNIIFAGENGSGKTKILEELNFISGLNFFVNFPIYSNKTHEIRLDISTEGYCDFNNEELLVDEALLICSIDDSNSNSYVIQFFSNGIKIEIVKKKGTADKLVQFKINGLYSNVDINYKPRNNIRGITNKTLDNDTNSIPEDMASEIIQLLIDIAIQDSCDVDSWIGQHRGEIVPENIYHTRLKRFTQAFEKIFGDTLKYKEIKNNSIPIFEKNNNEIEIQSLSSGEKQVIFRGVYLLRNKNSLKGVPVFIDEPEISMHPKWEEMIFEYYKNIFSEENIQTSQIFIATHSEHILSNVLNYNDSLVIKIKNNTLNKFYKNGTGVILPTMTLAEIKYSIFDLYTTDFHTLLYGYIQQNFVSNSVGTLINNPNIFQTDEWLKSQNAPLKNYVYNNTTYKTLPTYIRNCIDHPDNIYSYTKEELIQSIENMIDIVK